MMNPVVFVTEGGSVAYQLTSEDMTKIGATELMHGGADVDDIISHRMCIMQLVSMVSTEHDKVITPETVKKAYQEEGLDLGSYSDAPICVSKAIRGALIELNDSDLGPGSRQRLKEIIPDVLNTCPVQRTTDGEAVIEEEVRTPEYDEAEHQRRRMLHGIDSESGGGLTMDERLDLIREAASLFRTAPLEIHQTGTPPPPTA